MESYIEKAIGEAVQIRHEYMASYEELQSVDPSFSEVGADSDDLEVKLTALSLFRGWHANQLLEHNDPLDDSRRSARLKLAANLHKAKVHWYDNQLAYYNGALIDAHAEGVRIKTDDYYALEKAQWQNAHIAPGQDLYSPAEAMRLDALTKEDLERNLLRYPEMSWEFSEAELAKSRDIVTRLPLTHTTQETALLEVMSTSSGRADILSYAKLRKYNLTANGFSSGGVKEFSAVLDEKMGLDNYVFMCLGLPHPGQGNDGRMGIAIIDSGILHDDNCIVTPDDISNMCPDVFHGAGVEYQRDLDSLERYRSTTVSGKGWIEVLARRLAKHRRESPDTPYPIKDCFTMGEIKYRDQVPRSAILALLTSEAEVQTYLHHISSDALAWPARRTFLS